MLAVTETGMAGIGLSIPQVIEREGGPYLAIAVHGPMTALPLFAPPKFGELHAFIGKRGIKPAGPKFFRYRSFDHEGDVTLGAGLPVAADTTADAGDVVADMLPAGHYAAAVHRPLSTAVRHLPDAEWLDTRHGLEPDSIPWRARMPVGNISRRPMDQRIPRGC